MATHIVEIWNRMVRTKYVFFIKSIFQNAQRRETSFRKRLISLVASQVVNGELLVLQVVLAG